MSHECIPVTAIPHSTRLFQDFLFHHQRVANLYPHAPAFEAVAKYARSLEFPAERRRRVADVLERQNREWGADDSTIASIAKLRNGAVAVVGGQQVGLFGGPLYSFLKAVSALQLAQQLEESGVPAVPVFWLATEDHDLAEVNHAVFPVSATELRTFTSTSRSKGEPPVGEVRFESEMDALAREVAQFIDQPALRDALLASYRQGETYGSAFAKLFAQVFAGRGLILLDPLDRELHKVATPLMRAAASRAGEIDAALLARGAQLRKADYHEQVRVTSDSTLLFTFESGSREVIHLAGDDFLVAAHKVPRAEMLARIESAPEAFSPNVLLRPLMQDYLLPTAAYFGGPAEIAYFAQVGVVYEKLLGRVTPVLPRLSLTVISTRMERLLKRYRLCIPDLFHGSEQLRERLAEQTLPAALQHELAAATDAVRLSLERIQKGLQKLDPSLVGAAERSSRKMQYQLEKLTTKAARAELRRNDQLTREAAEILTILFPHKGLQERTIPGIYLLAAYGPSLLDRMVEIAAEHCPGHHLLYV